MGSLPTLEALRETDTRTGLLKPAFLRNELSLNQKAQPVFQAGP